MFHKNNWSLNWCQLRVPLPMMPLLALYSWSAMHFLAKPLEHSWIQFGIPEMLRLCSWNSWMEEGKVQPYLFLQPLFSCISQLISQKCLEAAPSQISSTHLRQQWSKVYLLCCYPSSKECRFFFSVVPCKKTVTVLLLQQHCPREAACETRRQANWNETFFFVFSLPLPNGSYKSCCSSTERCGKQNSLFCTANQLEFMRSFSFSPNCQINVLLPMHSWSFFVYLYFM